MTQKNDLCPQMLSALKNANSILLCTHVSPDGDAIGATLAMGLGLRSLGCRVTLACADPVPGQFLFLPGASDFVLPEGLAAQRFDAALAIDAASAERMGACRDAFFSAPLTMQMDHHPDNPRYCMYNQVDGGASAAGCVVYRYLRALDIPITQEIAQCLYCAISTDTGNFRFQNTTAEAFSIMADLMKAGLDLSKVARPLHQLREAPHVRLLGKALDSLCVFGKGKCACMALSAQDYHSAQAKPEHNTAIVNYALDIPGVEMAFLAEEREDGQVKASLRSLPPWNMAKIAQKYGGGGHMFAAGLRYDGTLEDLLESLKNDMLQLAEEGK